MQTMSPCLPSKLPICRIPRGKRSKGSDDFVVRLACGSDRGHVWIVVEESCIYDYNHNRILSNPNRPMPPHILSLIQSWLTSRPLAPNTLRLYQLETTRFAAWLTTHPSPHSTVNPDDIDNYLDALQYAPTDTRSQFDVRRRKGLSESSLNQARQILNSFFSWATKAGHMARNPMWDCKHAGLRSRVSHRVRDNQSGAPVLPDGLSRALCGGADLKTEEYLRAASIAHLAFWVGASRAEIAALRLGDVTFSLAKPSVRLTNSVGSQEQIPMPTHSCEVIREYIRHRQRWHEKLEPDAPLIASLRSSRGVSGWTVRYALRKWQESMSKDRQLLVGPQQLKRLFQGAAIEGGIQERIVARHLRVDRLVVPPVSLRQVAEKQLHEAVTRQISCSRPR